MADKAACSTFIAVTDRRIITAAPRALLLRGEPGESYPLRDVRFVRRPEKENGKIRPTLDVITEQQDLRWMFPSAANAKSIDQLATLLRTAVEVGGGDQTTIGKLPK